MMSNPWKPSDAEPARPSADADVYSPDRSIHITASHRGDVTVEVQGLRRHSEDSLARQVRAAVRLALASLQPSMREAEPAAEQRRSEW